jgi:hypothetical protein
MSITEARKSHPPTPKLTAARHHTVSMGLVLVLLFLAIATVTVTAIAFWDAGTQPVAPTTPTTPDFAGLRSPNKIGDTSIGSGGRIYQIDELVAMEKERMARDYIKYAAARARLVTSPIGPLPGGPHLSNRWGVGGSEL